MDLLKTSNSANPDGILEKTILLEELNENFTYSLSNSLDYIKSAIQTRFGKKVNLEKAVWKPNPHLSESVKKLMNEHNVNYSVTIIEKESEELMYDRYLIVNMRSGDRWFYSNYFEIKGVFLNWYTVVSTMLNTFLKEKYGDNVNVDNLM
ncbi:MAG: hypothetical protein FWG89_02295 [Treponema sp.]|nr:hypothetical protein [Treponema sp.]